MIERLRKYEREHREPKPEPEHISDEEEYVWYYRRSLAIVQANIAQLNYLRYGSRKPLPRHGEEAPEDL